MRARVAHRDYKLTEPYPEEWLLVEWPKGEKEPTKYWLSTLPDDISLHRLVDHAKLRWRIEHDYKELKQEVLGDFEGRGWRGFQRWLRFFEQNLRVVKWELLPGLGAARVSLS